MGSRGSQLAGPPACAQLMEALVAECRPDRPLQVLDEEPGPVVHLEPRGTGVPALIGVQRLLPGAEGLEPDGQSGRWLPSVVS